MKNNCFDCNKSLQDCTCMEDTIDMKQESIEEAAERLFPAEWDCYEKESFIEGAQWQAERMYSEEQMIEFGFSTYCYISELMGVPFNLISENKGHAMYNFEKPSHIVDCYITASEKSRKQHGRNYWDAIADEEKSSNRFLFGEEMLWFAHAVPVGEREVRGLLPISTIDEMESYIGIAAQGILEFHFTGNWARMHSICPCFFTRKATTMDFEPFVQ